jgi:hypothetical protein
LNDELARLNDIEIMRLNEETCNEFDKVRGDKVKLSG